MLKDAAKYYRRILDSLTGGLISVDMSGTVGYINPMAGKILHWDETHKSLETDYNKAFESFPALRQVIREAIETSKTVRRAEISIMHASVPLTIGYSTMQVRDRQGRNLGVIVNFQDISFAGGGKK